MPIDEKLQQMLLETFRAELQDIHQSLISTLLSLEKIKNPEALEESLKELFRFSHNLKGASSSASIPEIASIAHGLENLFQEWREKIHFPTPAEISATLKVSDNLISALKLFDEGKAIEVEKFLSPLRGEQGLQEIQETTLNEFIKLPLNRIERVNAKANEFIVNRLKLTNWFKEFEHLVKDINELPKLTPLAPLVKNLNQITAESGQLLGEFSRAIQGLQDEIKAMRMIPIATLLKPLSRTVRDISAKLNKSVDLDVYGGDIELDKAIMDAIKDPLQHLVRNAIDHGIEETKERKKAKKPIPAKLRIEVSQSSGKIILKVMDDGRGIDLEKVKKHALTLGLYDQNELRNLPSEQVLDCIFASGFSLREEVTEISGRGVGLDVVKSDLLKIKASISVTTTLKKGTTFTLVLPLTLATTRGVFFKLKEQTFMIPTLSLRALYALKTDELIKVNNQVCYLINNKPIPLVHLNQVIGEKNEGLKTKKTYYGLYIDYPGIDLLVCVDAIVNEHDCVVKPLPEPFSQLQQYIGITLTGDSSLVLVLEPTKLIQMAVEKKNSRSIHQNLEAKESPPKKVLIVDDSLTTRSLCSNSLEAAGFNTTTAINGKKAWSLLQKQSYDCVITDIVMPELDGIQLTKLIKNDKKLAHIPVIMISLLNSKKDKEQGLEAGANAFLAKSEFDTHSLLETMGTLL